MAKAHSRVGRAKVGTVAAYFSVDPPADLADRLGEVDAPVRVVAGAPDYATGLAPVLALAKLFPRGEAVVLDDCGHYPWVERPPRSGG
ncbi:MAG: alpha/beta hydrolase [Pseudonocardiaceae bacterium]|nr:alpha/beta hydrolase [Pseudonocardiaceae bacterium]